MSQKDKNLSLFYICAKLFISIVFIIWVSLKKGLLFVNHLIDELCQSMDFNELLVGKPLFF